VAMPFGGLLTRALGTRTLCIAASVLGPAGFVLLPHVQAVWAFAAVLMITGAMNGLWEVCLNIHGADVSGRWAGRSCRPCTACGAVA